MRRILGRAIWPAIGLVLLGLAVRLAWVATATETGWEMLRKQWRGATIGLFLSEPLSIPAQHPPDQAEFWLREVERILALHPDDAQLAMGAACVLDTYSRDFLPHYRRGPASGNPIRDIDWRAAGQAADAFEERCSKRVLELAARATELDPSNPQWWRLRALLMWRGSSSAGELTPRDPNWPEVLKQGARHDPDNALYDYLGALADFRASATREFRDESTRLIVYDAEVYERGLGRLQAGQAKPLLAGGGAELTATAALLNHSTLPRADHPSVVDGRVGDGKLESLFLGVEGWLRYHAIEATVHKDFAALRKWFQRQQRLFDQYDNAGLPHASHRMVSISRTMHYWNWRERAAEYPQLFSPQEAAELTAREREARLAVHVLGIVSPSLDNLAVALDPSLRRILGVEPRELLPRLGMILTLQLAVVLLAVGGAAWALAKWLSPRNAPRVGVLGRGLTCAAALGSTILVLGLAPADIMSIKAQHWMFTLLLIGGPAAVVVAGGVLWFLQRRVQFRLRTLLAITTALGVLLGVVSLAKPEAATFQSFPFALSMSPRGWGVLPAEQLSKAIQEQGAWCWPAFQWGVHQGHLATAALWGLLLGLAAQGKLLLRRPRDGEPESAPRDRWGAMFATIAGAFLAVSAAMWGAYLVLAPGYLRQVDDDFQRRMAYARHPDVYWSHVAQTLDDLRNDDALMANLRAKVQQDMARSIPFYLTEEE